MITRLFLIPVIIFLFQPVLLPPAARSDDLTIEIQKKDSDIRLKKKQKEEIRRKEREIRKKLKKIKHKQGSVLNLISRYRKDYQKARKNLFSTEDDLTRVEGEIISESETLQRVEKKLVHQEFLLKRRVLSLYKSGRTGRVESLMTFRDIDDLSHRVMYLRAISAYNARLVQDAKNLRHEKRKRIRRYEKKLTRLREISRKRKKEIKDLEKKKTDLNILYREIRKDKKIMEKRAREIARAKKSLSRKLNKLFRIRKELTAEQKRRKMALIKQRGYLPWPVKHVLEVSKSNFGGGINLKTPEGTVVRTIAKGNVKLVSNFKGFGNTVVVDHDGGNYTLYSHLSRMDVKVGDHVKSMDPVGVVGSSDWKPDEFILYFEIRINGNNVAPKKWLKKRRR